MDVLEEGVEVLRCGGSEVHLIGVLVHVHDEERVARREHLGVVTGPCGAERAGVELEAEDDPADASAESGSGCSEVLFPARRGAVGLAERFVDRARALAVAAEVSEVCLVERFRIPEGELALA